MRKLLIALALATSSCTANQALENLPIVGNVCEAADRTLIDDKAVLAAHTLYNVPAFAYVKADKDGLFITRPALKAQLKPMLIELYKYDIAIKAAKGSVNCDFNSMKELSARVNALLPRK